MPLFDPERHEPLTATQWDENRAREAIARIAADAYRAFSATGLWPIHPLDVSPERPPDCLKMLYNGAAGTIWALHRLDEIGLARLAHDFAPTVRELARRHRGDLENHAGVRDYIGSERNAYLFGETGLHLLEWKVSPSQEAEDRLHAAIESKIGDVRGLVWGGAGAMLAALFLSERTGDERWRDLYRRHADALWQNWDYADAFGCHLWTSELYGRVEKRLGALHGFLANAAPLLRGRHLLTSEQQRELPKRIVNALKATAVREGTQRNWPNNAEALDSDEPVRLFVQHCNGAPGAVNTLSVLGSGDGDDIDAMLLSAGELTWQAGPPAKLPGLCHGAPGNGYAFLKLFARTGDAAWLAQARCFAMHAVTQSDAALARHGQRKFALWTGDLGLAIYLADCIGGTSAFPTLDYF